jgi:glycine/D-amino acid oxidase-like deaminating enzyme
LTVAFNKADYAHEGKAMTTSQIVVGGGIAGVSAALYLRRAGLDVTLIDPLPSAGGASFGNAGIISADTVVPIAVPGMLRKVPGWLADPMGPLTIRQSYLPKATPWLLRWLRAGRMRQVLKLRRIARLALADLGRIPQPTGSRVIR